MKIIWAIDPFDNTAQPSDEALDALKTWKDRAGAEIQPVFVADLETGGTGMSADSRRRLHGAKQAAAQLLRDRLQIAWTLEPEVITVHSPSVSGAAERLVKFARLEKVDAIAVSSHGRGGVSKAIFGSFAESLLKLSEVPVIFLSRKMDDAIPSPHLSRILFATDFSEASRQGFLRFMKHAAAIGSRVVIYHHLVPPPELLTITSPPGVIPYSSQRESERQLAETQLEIDAWVKWAASQRVQAEAYLDRSPGRTSERILTAAREAGSGMIGLATENDAFKSFLLGGVAKNVFRDGELIVWVAGPTCLESPKKSDIHQEKSGAGL